MQRKPWRRGYTGLAASLRILECREREVARDCIIDSMISYVSWVNKQWQWWKTLMTTDWSRKMPLFRVYMKGVQWELLFDAILDYCVSPNIRRLPLSHWGTDRKNIYIENLESVIKTFMKFQTGRYKTKNEYIYI
jgi:hypothetical protein